MERVPFSCTFDEGSFVLTVRGEVDVRDATVLGSHIDTHGRTGPMSLDLSQVTYLTSDALGVILRSQIAARKDDRPIEIWARSGSIAHEILRVSGVPHLDLPDDVPPHGDERSRTSLGGPGD